MKALLGPLVPYRVKLIVRGWLERDVANPLDVDRVKAITANQWRTLSQRASRYLDTYWSDADVTDSRGRRRSVWLADLPPFREAGSVLELGCGAGRNLYVLQQRYPALRLFAIDINPTAIAHARARVRGELLVGDVYDLEALLGDETVDVIFTMGVLIHLHPETLADLIQAMRRRARRYLVFVEQVSHTNEVVKGPARWRPTRRVTGDYIQWSPNLPAILDGLGLGFDLSAVPVGLQSNGARHCLVVPLTC